MDIRKQLSVPVYNPTKIQGLNGMKRKRAGNERQVTEPTQSGGSSSQAHANQDAASFSGESTFIVPLEKSGRASKGSPKLEGDCHHHTTVTVRLDVAMPDIHLVSGEDGTPLRRRSIVAVAIDQSGLVLQTTIFSHEPSIKEIDALRQACEYSLKNKTGYPIPCDLAHKGNYIEQHLSRMNQVADAMTAARSARVITADGHIDLLTTAIAQINKEVF